jgi:3-deoxy-D-manno-octulosonic-acid transferase
MFFFYQILISIIIILSPLIVSVRILKNKEHKKRFIEKFCVPSKKRSNGKLIWFHGASVGEILSIVPIIKNFEKNKSIDQILVTSSTLSSSKVLNKFKFKKTIHQFYPIDHIHFTTKFLKYWKPNLAIFIESEIWPSMFKELDRKNIPLILLNARLTKKTFNKWKKVKNFTKSIFGKIKKAYPQNLETKSFLKTIGVSKINHIGNLKFIENKDKKKDKVDNNLKDQLKTKKIWIASSTHRNEEIFCAKAHIELRKKIKNLITIIIPRHVDRSKKIISEIEKLNLNVTSHSSKNKNLKDIDIYIVDTFGETEKFYKIGCSVFLGGSIIKRGGQNPLEPARYGAKILHGPNIDNFKDIYGLLKSFKISKKITSPKELALSIVFKRRKNIGTKIKNIGEIILKKTIKELNSLINNEFKKT